MTTRDRCAPGDWVEVERILLAPADRSPNLPPETAERPLLVWVKGFARADAALGEKLTVETMTGRLVTGQLSEVLPGYFHTFGRPIAELAHVGPDLRARLAEWRRDTRGVSAGATDCVDTICYGSENPPDGTSADTSASIGTGTSTSAEDSSPTAPGSGGGER